MVSIIIPCYNVEKYLMDCLKSIQDQTFPSIEVVLIDDGSTDETPAICDKFAGSNSNVKVFHIPNGGVSNARNIALRECNGEYIAFVDADDMITPDYIRRLHDTLKAESFDLVYCKEQHFTESKLVKSSPEEKKCSISTISNCSDFNYCGSKTHSTVWGCLFRREILEGLAFRKDLFIAEDSLFFNSALLKCNKIGFLDVPLYYYRIRNDSATGKAPYTEKKMTEITSWMEIVGQNDRLYPDSLLAISSHSCLGYNAIKGIKLMQVNGGFDKERMAQLVSIIRKEKPFIKFASISYKKRLEYQLFSFFPNLCGWLYKQLKKVI